MSDPPKTQRTRTRQLAYAARGNCQACGKRKPFTATLCRICAKKHAQAGVAQRARYLAAGLCVQCGTRPATSKPLCDKCRERHNLRIRGRKEALKRRGLCVDCAKPATGHSRCETCLAKERERKALTSA